MRPAVANIKPICLVVCCLFKVSLLWSAQPEIDLRIVKGPYLQWPTQNSMTIMWETSVEASSEVTYFETRRLDMHGRVPGQPATLKALEESKKTVKDKLLRKIHEVIITDLRPSTTYSYKVISRVPQGPFVESQLYSLKTAVAANESFSFVVSSEMGGSGQPKYNVPLFKKIELYRPDFMLSTGDVVMNGRIYDDWGKYLFTPGKDLFTNTPFYLSIGNHEKLDRLLEKPPPWFFDFVSYPDPETYYSFDYGNAHFVALDSVTAVEYKTDESGEWVNEVHKGEGSLVPGSSQYKFLANDLKKSTKATWKFVFFHYSPYVSADYQVESMRSILPILDEHNVDFVLTSHTVVYERSYPIRNGKINFDQGITYLVVGGAGENHHWFNPKRSWHTAHALAVPHFVHFTVAGNRLEMKAIDFEGRVFDTIERRK